MHSPGRFSCSSKEPAGTASIEFDARFLQARSVGGCMTVSAETVPPRPVRLDLADVSVNGDLGLPADARALVIVAHGSGSSRHSPRNRAVAEVMQHGRFGTLLLDLLTEAEDKAD